MSAFPVASMRPERFTVHRLSAALWAETRIAWRYGIVALAGVVTLLWSLTLAVLPPAGAQQLLPLLLFVDTAGFGALIAVALMLFERLERVDAARGVTPLRPWETVTARVTVLTALAVAMALPMTVAAGTPLDPGAVMAVCGGVAMTSILLVGTCMALGGGAAGLSTAFLRLLPGIVLLIVVPVLHLSGAVREPMLFLAPSTAGAELIALGTAGQGPTHPLHLWAPAWGVLGAAGVCAWAARTTRASVRVPRRRSARGPETGTGPGKAPIAPVAAGRSRPRSQLVSFVRWDLLTGRRDPLLLVALFAPALLALLLRGAYPTVSTFVRTTYGFDLASVMPLVFSALVLLHVPTIVGSVLALRFMEDVDDRALLMLRVSPLSLRGHLAYRSGLAGLVSLFGLAVAAPLSGLSPTLSAGLVVAIVLASTTASLFVLVVASVASNKVEALVVIKALGALSVLVPVVAWTVPASVAWLILVAPPAWALLTLPESALPALSPGVVLCCGLLWTLVLCVMAARRTETRLES